MLYEPNSSTLTIKYYPDGDTLTENPPRFTFMPSQEESLGYSIEISKTPDFSSGVTARTGIVYNFYTWDEVLDEGTYFWRYKQVGKEDYSKVRSFVVVPQLPKTPLPDHKERFQGATKAHPRIWMNQNQIDTFKEALKKDKNHCGFDAFYQHSVKPRLSESFVQEPLPYPDNKRVIALWRNNYMMCQEALVYIRSLSVAGILLDDQEIIEKAKAALLEISAWKTDGPTSRDYNDECSFRVVYAIAFGYDWLYSHLSEVQRQDILEVLLIRTRQVATHVIDNSKIHYSLYDSHAVRSLSSVLTPCCMAMLFEKPEAEQWLNYTIDYFSAIYTPWGGANGGWAEGPMYWTTAMAFLIDALNLLKSYLGIDFYKRPFFQKTGDFPLYCNPHDTWRASFCDQSSLGEKAGIKTAFNMRQFAAVSKNPNYQWYFEQIMKRSIMNPQDYFNKGWWDLYFDDMVFRHDYGLQPSAPPEAGLHVNWFADIGWVAVNQNMQNPDEHILLLTKSSPYGSVSHSHGDQNSFLLFAFSEPLIIKSGYYVGFFSSMHMDWRRQTRSHNTLTIDGLGQYAQMDKVKQLSAKGTVVSVEQVQNYVHITEDATVAYLEQVPYLESFVRELYFVDGQYLVVVDHVVLAQEGTVNFLLHGLSSFQIKDNKFHLSGEKADLKGTFIESLSGIESITETDKFEGVDPTETEGLQKQFHLQMNTKKAKNHCIVTLLCPVKKGEHSYVTPIKDDQGHDIFFYFSNNEKTFTLRINGNKRY